MDGFFLPAFRICIRHGCRRGVASELSLNLVSGSPYTVVVVGVGGSMWGDVTMAKALAIPHLLTGSICGLKPLWPMECGSCSRCKPRHQ